VVVFLYDYFHQEKFLASLDSVSDGILDNDGKKYIDFDLFKAPENCCDMTKGINSLSSVDSLLINQDENHIILVEFKDMDSFANFNLIVQWLKEKECSIKIKIPDSILLLGYFLREKGYRFDDFLEMKKSFIYVYKNSKSKSKINNHLKFKFTKYNFMLANTKIIEAQNYQSKFLS